MARTRTSPAGERKRRSERGFTLLELLIVLTIIGLMAALIPGFMLRETTAFDLERATRALATGLRQARSEALFENREQLFTLDLEGRRFLAGEDEAPVQLDPMIDLRLLTARAEQLGETIGQIRFFPDGSSTGGRILLVRAGSRSVIEVDWLTGMIVVSSDGS